MMGQNQASHNPNCDECDTPSKALFVTHGIPEMVISDNGRRFSVEPLPKFAASYGFVHTTNSPDTLEPVERSKGL